MSAPLPGREPEPHEWTDAALTFVPAIVLAVVARWGLLAYAGFSERRALFAAIGVGIAVGVVLERVIDRRRRRGDACGRRRPGEIRGGRPRRTQCAAAGRAASRSHPAPHPTMPSLIRLRSPLAAALAATLLSAAACGGADDAADTLAAAAGDTAGMAAPADAPAPTADVDAPLTVEDIDRWQRGMAAELEAVREAGVQLTRATTGTDSVSAIFAANDMSTRAAGARGAGLDEQRYGRVASALSAVVRYMVPLSTEMNLEGMPAEVRTQMQASRDQSLEQARQTLPAEVFEALQPRAEALRRQEMELVGERLKAAGMAG